MIAVIVLALLVMPALAQDVRPRLIVLTDIGGDPDDQQSMIRLMTYSNEFQIEGLIASAAGIPGELKEDVVRPELIREIVQAYGSVRPNLAHHAKGYPSTERLLSVIRPGNPLRGVNAIGEGKDTEGSNWIISVVDRSDSRPVNIAIWGGPTDLAQALWNVRKNRTDAALKQFLSRIRVHAIGHQDDTGPWILENFPTLFYILSAAGRSDIAGQARPKVDSRTSTYRGMYLGGDESLTSREWIDEHVRLNHGPLGALYPMKTWTTPNPHSVLKEGDTPSWFYFLPNGLNDPAHPEWGGWGGRFQPIGLALYNDAADTVEAVTDARAAVWRWRPYFQADWQARMDWCAVGNKKQANHAPRARLNGDGSNRVLHIAAKGGSEVALSAKGSSDPDGGALSYRWFQYPEAGTYQGRISFNESTGERFTFTAPQVPEPQTVHMILHVKDSGAPSLSTFRRAVITIHPGDHP